ncbi:hypothetical protein KCP75_15480 [Salmonella enterica subsp. enterica]|nr:hypothetical protein KCP75_15480 [Salmonella enterica subsp. enterica]
MNLQNRGLSAQLISVLHREHSDIVRSVSVYDDHNRLFVTSNFPSGPLTNAASRRAPFSRRLSVDRHGDSYDSAHPDYLGELFAGRVSDCRREKYQKAYAGVWRLELDLKSVGYNLIQKIFISSVMMLLYWHCADLWLAAYARVTGPIRNMVNTVDRIRRGQLDSQAVEGFMLGELDVERRH